MSLKVVGDDESHQTAPRRRTGAGGGGVARRRQMLAFGFIACRSQPRFREAQHIQLLLLNKLVDRASLFFGADRL